MVIGLTRTHLLKHQSLRVAHPNVSVFPVEVNDVMESREFQPGLVE